MRFIGLVVIVICALPLMSLKRVDPSPMIVPYPPPVERPPRLPALALPDLPLLAKEPALVPVQRRIKVTACSPEDSDVDAAYYRVHGYEGEPYNIAAYPGAFPKGTLIRVPGYLEKSHPGQFWEVDSKGGSVIRRSARRGVTQIDVKFRTRTAVMNWGVQWLTVDVITAELQARWERDHAVWLKQKAVYDDAAARRAAIQAENARRGYGGLGNVPLL